MADGKVIIEIDAQEDGFLEKLRSMEAAAEGLAGGALQNLDQWLQENQISSELWSRMVYNATETVMNSFSALDTSLDMDLQEMAANLTENILAYNNWNANLKTLMDAAVQTGSQAAVDFVYYMQEMGIGAADQVQSMVDNMDYTMQTFPPLMEQAVQAGMVGVYTQVENGKAGVTEAASGLMDGAVQNISGADLRGAAAKAGAGISPGLSNQAGSVKAASETLITAVTALWSAATGRFRVSGQTAAQGIAVGLQNGRTAVTASAENLASGMVSAFTAAAEKCRTAGTAAAQNLAQGISGGQGMVTSAASSAAASAYGAVGGLSWYSLGYNISSGIASGVRGGSYLITSAARSAASAALSSAKSALGIHSPSRVFREEVGRQIPAGIALGIEKATPEARQAASVSAEQLLSSAREAVAPQVDGAARSFVTNNTVYREIGGRRGLSVTVPLTVDGREFARATAKYTGRQMAYLEV